MNKRKTLLMILDGWGIGNKSKSDVIFNADTPHMDELMKKYGIDTANVVAAAEKVIARK